MPAKKEAFAQWGYLRVVESAANTLTYNGLSVFSNVLGQKAMVIHRIQYAPTFSTIALLAAANDILTFGMSGTDAATAPDYASAEFYDVNDLMYIADGTPATSERPMNPLVEKDFTGLPSGGILVPADRLFAFAQGANLASAGTVDVRFAYTIMELSAAEYLELAQSMRVLR